MAGVKEFFRKLNSIKPLGFWPGILVGIVYFSYIFSPLWFLQTSQIVEIGNPLVSFGLVSIIFVLVVLVTSVFWGISFWLFKKIYSRYGPRPLSALFLAGIFVIAEYIRSITFGVIFWGSGTLLGPHWTFGNIAYWFPFPYFLRSASVWGIYGIDFVLAALISTVLFLFLKKNYKSGLISLIILVLAIFLSVAQIKATPQKSHLVTVSIIQTNKTTENFDSPNNLLQTFSSDADVFKKAAAAKSDLIIFPEGANFSNTLLNFLTPEKAQAYIVGHTESDSLIIDNDAILTGGNLKSRSILISPENGLVSYYDKELLTPTGEFLPYILDLPSKFLSPKLNNLFKSNREFSVGDSPGILDYMGLKIKVLLCSESASPGLARKPDKNLIVVQNSLAIFNHNKNAEKQVLATYRFRAAENDKYTAVASNFGYSYIIDNDGNVLKSTSAEGPEILTGDIVLNDSQTWYNKLGDWPILLVSLIIVIYGLSSNKWLKKQ